MNVPLVERDQTEVTLSDTENSTIDGESENKQYIYPSSYVI